MLVFEKVNLPTGPLMKTLIFLFIFSISLQASAAKWVPQTKDQHNKIWKTIMSLDLDATKALLESGLHPDLSTNFTPGFNSRNGDGPSPIIIIVDELEKSNYDDTIKMIKLFLSYGADINLVPYKKKEYFPQTAYAMIPEGKCFDYENEPEYKMALFLLKNGYDANIGNDINGRWTTAVASKRYCGPIVDLLFQNGADASERDCASYRDVYDSYVDEGGLSTDLEYQEYGYPPHSLNYFRKAVTAKYGQGNPSFNPDDYCAL